MNLNFTLVLQVISFLILLGALTKILYRPFTKYLDIRKQEIRELVEKTELDRKKAEENLEISTETLKKTKENALRLKTSAARDADIERIKILDGAKKEAISILEKAEVDVKKEIEETKAEAKKDIAGLAVEIAEKILGREINEKDHKALIDESLRDISRER